LAVFGYFVLAGGGGGLLGWLVAVLSKAQPTTSLAVNGVLYGAGGALALRADFRPRQHQATPADAAVAASLLARGLVWTENALDEMSRRGAQAWLQDLDDDALIEEAYSVSAHIAQRRSVPQRTREASLSLLVPAMEKVRQGGGARVEGRAHLVTFCASYLIAEHLAKRPASTRARADRKAR